VPMVLGVLLGRWLDGRFEKGYWAPGLLVFGLAIGCYNAWRMIVKEH